MSNFDDPNREAVGLAPIWSETGDNVVDPPPPETHKAKATSKAKADEPRAEEPADK